MRQFTICFLLCLLTACGGGEQKSSGFEPLRVTCTTGLLADAVRQIGGDSVEVTALMGPGVDPHLYKATQGDLEKLKTADLIVCHGLHLEGKMAELLTKMSKNRPVLVAGELVGEEHLIQADSLHGVPDPHIWFEVRLWKMVATGVAARLQQAKPMAAAYFAGRLMAWQAQLDRLDEEIRQTMADIPAGQRILITSHDAFRYFGRAYGVEVHGLQGISTQTEFGLRDVSDMVRLINSRKIRAVFVETSVPPKALEAVIEGCSQQGQSVVIGGHLYSDALDAPGSQADTYVGMLRTNARQIAGALK